MVTGVEIRGERVRIRFKWRGQWVYETTPFRATPGGLKQAAKLRALILREIEAETFVYRKHFPDSPRATRDSTSFYDLARKYIAVVEPHKATSTIKGYRKSINAYWLPIFAEDPVAGITTGRIREAISESGLAKLSDKTFNNAMTPLRGIFELAYELELIDRNPCDKIKWQKFQTPLPDPLNDDERDRVLAALPDEWLPYFQVAFGTGMRPSELIALRWSDIDLKAGIVNVECAYVEKATKDTKTKRTRLVEITNMAHDGLLSQRPRTFMRSSGLVFEYLGKQINNDKPPRNAWNDALRRAGVRHRKAYSTRHTWASVLLEAGVSPYVVAEQMGNSVAMVMKHYARWIRQRPTSVKDLIGSKPGSKSKRKDAG